VQLTLALDSKGLNTGSDWIIKWNGARIELQYYSHYFESHQMIFYIEEGKLHGVASSMSAPIEHINSLIQWYLVLSVMST
jgi:hypothetical protein